MKLCFILLASMLVSSKGCVRDVWCHILFSTLLPTCIPKINGFFMSTWAENAFSRDFCFQVVDKIKVFQKYKLKELLSPLHCFCYQLKCCLSFVFAASKTKSKAFSTLILNLFWPFFFRMPTGTPFCKTKQL